MRVRAGKTGAVLVVDHGVAAGEDIAAVHVDPENLVPGIQGFDPIGREHGIAHRAVVKGVALLEENHAHAGHDVVEDAHEHHDPAHTGEALDEGFDDGSQAREGLREAEDAEHAKKSKDGETLEADPGKFDVGIDDDDEVKDVPPVVEILVGLPLEGQHLGDDLDGEDDEHEDVNHRKGLFVASLICL